MERSQPATLLSQPCDITATIHPTTCCLPRLPSQGPNIFPRPTPLCTLSSFPSPGPSSHCCRLLGSPSPPHPSQPPLGPPHLPAHSFLPPPSPFPRPSLCIPSSCRPSSHSLCFSHQGLSPTSHSFPHDSVPTSPHPPLPPSPPSLAAVPMGGRLRNWRSTQRPPKTLDSHHFRDYERHFHPRNSAFAQDNAGRRAPPYHLIFPPSSHAAPFFRERGHPTEARHIFFECPNTNVLRQETRKYLPGFRLYAARNAFAEDVGQQVPTPIVSRIMNHSTVKMTQHYMRNVISHDQCQMARLLHEVGRTSA